QSRHSAGRAGTGRDPVVVMPARSHTGTTPTGVHRLVLRERLQWRARTHEVPVPVRAVDPAHGGPDLGSPGRTQRVAGDAARVGVPPLVHRDALRGVWRAAQRVVLHG